jgi:hypothetical protein
MMWALGGLLVCAAIVVAGRRHSRHLDELDRRWLESGDQRSAAELKAELTRFGRSDTRES